MADVTDAMLDGYIASFPTAYVRKFGRTSDEMYKACFSAYMMAQVATSVQAFLCCSVQTTGSGGSRVVYLAKMVNGFIFYDVVRCWCLFPGTALWDWVLNSGLVEKLPSASCQVFSSLDDSFAAMFLVLLDVAMMWLASGWHVALARSVLLHMFVGLLAAFKVSKPGSEAAFSACLLHAASGGLTHCGLCPFLVDATLMWLAPAGCLRCEVFGFFVDPIAVLFMDGSGAAFSARLLDAATGGLALGGSCPLMVGATLVWLAPAGFESLLLQQFYAFGLWMCALLVAVPKTESVPVVFESSIEVDVAASMVAGSETETVPVVFESSIEEDVGASLVAGSETETVHVVAESLSGGHVCAFSGCCVRE